MQIISVGDLLIAPDLLIKTHLQFISLLSLFQNWVLGRAQFKRYIEPRKGAQITGDLRVQGHRTISLFHEILIICLFRLHFGLLGRVRRNSKSTFSIIGLKFRVLPLLLSKIIAILGVGRISLFFSG